MTQEQQKLYDKLLKKVNEYCLGAAAEDLIAAIDALVESYEILKANITSKPLEVWSLVKKYMNAYHHQVVNADIETVEGYPIGIIEDSLKALEIIKKFAVVDDGEIYICSRGYITLDDEPIITARDSKEEYDLLKEVLK